MQSHTGTVDGALLPSAANTLNGQARRTAKKHPVRSPTFSKLPPPYCIFVQRDYHSGDFFHIRVSSYLICACFYRCNYIIQHTKINCVDSEYLYFISCFFIHFYIFPDYFRLYFNDLIFITDIFLYCLIYFLRLY